MLQSKAARVFVLLVLCIGFFVLLLLVSGASIGQLRSSTSAEDIVTDALLQSSDFPTGWRAGALLNQDVAGAVGRAITFRGSRDPMQTWVNTSEEIYHYSTIEVAKEAYAGWLAEYFPATTDAWLHATEIDFLNHADQIRTGCLPVSINGKSVMSCRIVTRYSNLIVVVLGNTSETQALTNADFQKILQAADQRVMKALTSQK